MKIYIILALVALVSAEEWKLKTIDEWSQIHKTCDERHKVSEELMEKAKAEKYPPKEVFEVVLCILRSIEVWDDSKGFSTDKWMKGLDSFATEQKINKTFLRDSLDKCSDDNSEGSSQLDWAYRWFKCYKDNENLFKTLQKVRFFE